MIFVLLLYMLLATTFVIGKAALSYGQPIFLIGIRMVLGGALLLSYVYCGDRRHWHFNRKDFWLFAQIAFFHIYLSFLLEFWSYQYVTASKAAFMFNLSPFITALFAYIFFRERMTLYRWVGLVVGFIGSLPILIAQAPAIEMSAGSFFFLSVPEICLLISATCGVYGWIVMKKLVVDRSYSPVFVNGVGMLVGGLGALITSLGFEKRPLLKAALEANDFKVLNTTGNAPLFAGSWADFFAFFGFIVLLILIANVIFYNAYGHLLKKYTPTFLSLVGLTLPLSAALFGWVFLGETVTLSFFVSVALVLLGALIFYRDELRESI